MSSPAETTGEQSRLHRSLGPGTAAALVIGNTIGSGIFTSSGFIARDVGSPTRMLALWLIGGLIAMAGALSYAELGAELPEAGGEYVYLREAFGPLVGFLSGWTSVAVGFSGAIAAAMIAFAGYVQAIVPALHIGAFSTKAIALGALWSITLIHCSGLRAGATAQRGLAAITVAAIAIVTITGFLFGHGNLHNFTTSMPVRGDSAVSLILVLYAYSGWNAAAYVAGEVEAPGRTLPLALVGGTASVMALYLALNAMYLYALPISAMSGVLAIAEKAMVALFGSFAARLLGAILTLTILGSGSAMVLAGPRVYFAMARDRLLPALGVVHPVRGTPARAIIAQSIWASVLILFFSTFEPVIVYTGFAVTLFTALAVVALIVIRRGRPDLPRPFVTPGYPWLPAAYIAVTIWILCYTVASRPMETALGALTIAAGVPLYLLARALNRPELKRSD